MKTITETQIAQIFIGSIIRNIGDNWLEIRKEFSDIFAMLDKDFNIDDENDAKLAVSFAVIALEVQVLENIFPDQATRIYQKAINAVSPLDDRIYMEKKIILYKTKFQKANELYIRNPNVYKSPLEEVASQILIDCFGERINEFYVQNPKTGVIRSTIDPLLARAIGNIIVSFVGFWKNVKMHFVIVAD